MHTLFFRLLHHEDKAAALAEAVGAVRTGQTPDAVVHAVDPASFRQVPGTPFAYWVSERIRRLFTELPRFEGDGRTVRGGLQTSDDFRFVSAWWEVPAAGILDGANGPDWRDNSSAFQTWCRQRTLQGQRWAPFAKGGAYSPYYADLHLVVNWEQDGAEMKAWANPLYGNSGWSRIIKSVDFYFRPGLTWPLRTNGLSFRAAPAGSIFGHKGPMAFKPSGNRTTLQALAVLMNSQGFFALMQMLVARVSLAQSFEVGLVQSIPVPELGMPEKKQLGELVESVVALKQSLDTADDTSHVFTLPALLQVPGNTLAERAQGWAERLIATEAKLTTLQQQIDAIACQLYGITEADQQAMQISPEAADSETDAEDDEDAADTENVVAADAHSLGFDLFSYALGLALGRWDVRYVTRQRACPELPDPFAPLPVCAPGTLSNANGLPAEPEDVSGDYPLRISWPGILVHDDGHPEDLVGRIRQACEIIWRAQASDVEQEACNLLGVRSLRDYFAKPTNFFAEHLKRYSKSRRQAPIYWPLQTPSGSYTLWLYYHRLTDQTLYTCVNDFVGPKLRDVTEQLAALRTKTDRNRQEEQELERLLDFEQELQDFRDELLRVARFWKPNLHDGVQITAAPFWKLFQHRPWQRRLKDTWDKLENGAYDWAHLAYSIWPDRVRNILQRHARSVWSGTGESQAQWGVIQAALQLIEACGDTERQLGEHARNQEALVDFYLGSLHEADRLQREFEQAAGGYLAAPEVMGRVIELARSRYRHLAETVPAERVGIRGDCAQFAGPRSMAPYRAGLQYFHGGASLQEAVVPVITVRLETAASPGRQASHHHPCESSKITLITGYDGNTQLAELKDKLGELQQSLLELDIVLDLRFNPNLHDREIRLDNGWVIKIGRGLDFYQRPTSWFEVGAHDMHLRKCLETKVDIFRS